MLIVDFGEPDSNKSKKTNFRKFKTNGLGAASIRSENCIVNENELRGRDRQSKESNCFIEPSFGVNDTRTINLSY
jgi:hypothetical protein